MMTEVSGDICHNNSLQEFYKRFPQIPGVALFSIATVSSESEVFSWSKMSTVVFCRCMLSVIWFSA